ncbi:SDR family NAD(P)-dependent oxidoreductase [Paraglaciecola sp.]|nr:SDR family NAD(P)-dependent oxidoreductase [Paraglaciecola sp.]MDB4281605.1 SDR family NAD(P)-dependent oxidoreductase [Paraglaciecola sp.]
MNNIITLDKTIEVTRKLHEVFTYVSEFSRIEQWDPAVAKASKLSSGKPGVGSRYQIDMKAGFSLYYEIIEFEANKRLLMTVDSKLFTAVEEIVFTTTDTDTDTGTKVRYIANFNFPAPVAIISRLNPGVMDRVGNTALEGLRKALEDNFTAPKASKFLAVADKLILPGVWRFTRLGYTTSRKRWNALSAYMNDRHAVITGATSGIGLAAAKQLAELGAELTLVVRDKNKAQQVVRELIEQTGNTRINIELADMSLMKDVHALADRLLKTGKPVDILINNAGALFNPRQQTTEGLEQSFALLLLGPYILSERLHPLLAKSESARVVNVLSGGMYSQKIQVNDLQSQRGEYSGSTAYARAKRGLMILTEEWAKRWQGDDISVNAMHPGWVDTPGVVNALPEFYKVTKCLLRTPEQGADTITWLAAATEASQVSGKFWLDREQHPSHLSKRTVETAAQRNQLLVELEKLEKTTIAT